MNCPNCGKPLYDDEIALEDIGDGYYMEHCPNCGEELGASNRW